MKPGVLNLAEKQGATFRLSLNWKDELGAQMNLTGYRARLVVRHLPTSSTAVLSCDSQGDSPTITLGGAEWNIQVVVNKTTMLAVKPGSYVWDLELTSGAGIDYPLLTGRFDLAGSTVQA